MAARLIDRRSVTDRLGTAGLDDRSCQRGCRSGLRVPLTSGPGPFDLRTFKPCQSHTKTPPWLPRSSTRRWVSIVYRWQVFIYSVRHMCKRPAGLLYIFVSCELESMMFHSCVWWIVDAEVMCGSIDNAAGSAFLYVASFYVFFIYFFEVL